MRRADLVEVGRRAHFLLEIVGAAVVGAFTGAMLLEAIQRGFPLLPL